MGVGVGEMGVWVVDDRVQSQITVLVFLSDLLVCFVFTALIVPGSLGISCTGGE